MRLLLRWVFASALAGRGSGDGGRSCRVRTKGVAFPLPLPLLLPLLLIACSGPLETSTHAPLISFGHLDHLLEFVEKDGAEMAIVHIYAEAPDYAWVHDDDEGAACVDDAARAAVVYLRDYELNGTKVSKRKAEALIRFVLYMQSESGVFFNFVWDSGLDINREHPNSRADAMSFWTARAVWALGRCTRVLAGDELATKCAAAVERTYPHIEKSLEAYGETFERNGRIYPRWLLQETAADATSELLLGLAAMPQTPHLDNIIDKLVEGIAMMQYGRIGEFPYGAHASWTEIWHAWGNAQTQALTALAERSTTSDPRSADPDRRPTTRETEEAQPDDSGIAQPGDRASADLRSPLHESTHFYPTLLVDGWMHSIDFAAPAKSRRFEQIAYGVRGVALGLLGLHANSGEDRYATMAGLAASWFTGNNPAGAVMYDQATGRGYDGISDSTTVNRNAGAESTIEALMTLIEIERVPEARRWLFARGELSHDRAREGQEYRYRTFRADGDLVAILLNLTDGSSSLLRQEDLSLFLDE